MPYLSGWLLCVAGWILADSLFVLIRFVGLSSVPVFATLDYDSFNHGLFFARSLVIGTLIGTIFFAVSRALETPAIRRRPYGVMILLHTLVNLICVALLLAGLRARELTVLDRPFTVAEFASRLFTVNFVVILTYYTMVSFLFVMIQQVDRKFGPGNLRRLILGTFYHPRAIEHIFMFLDLKNSTSHAERLGHLKFGSLIQDCFIDLSVVSGFGAQIYQYVGDEVILHWSVDSGVANANCLQAYFAFQHRLEQRREHYQKRYGLFPEFKAGVNIGFATVLEVGEIKREIAYLGDALNTAARIMDQCNAHQEGLLISKFLRDRLPSIPRHLEIQPAGVAELRGRSNSVGLYRVRERNPSARLENGLTRH